MTKAYQPIVSHYERRLEEFGDTHRGVDWPNAADAETRYRVHLELIKPDGGPGPVSLLDLGCGAAHLYGYMLEHGVEGIAYSGLDVSEAFVALSRAKYPALPFYCLDIMDEPTRLPRFDYVVMNGVLTEKRELTYELMLAYAKRLIVAAFRHAEIGLAFNVMSTHVDAERDDLFHLPFDTLAAFLTRHVSRNFAFRNDYGLYEYTAFVYR